MNGAQMAQARLEVAREKDRRDAERAGIYEVGRCEQCRTPILAGDEEAVICDDSGRVWCDLSGCWWDWERQHGSLRPVSGVNYR